MFHGTAILPRRAPSLATQQGLEGWFAGDRTSFALWRTLTGANQHATFEPESLTAVTRGVTPWGDGVQGDGTQFGRVVCEKTGWDITSSRGSFAVWFYIPTATEAGCLLWFGNTTDFSGVSIGVGSTDFDGVGGNVIGAIDGFRWCSTGVSYGGAGLHHLGFTLGGGDTIRIYLDGRRIYQDSGGLPTIDTGGRCRLLGQNGFPRPLAATVLDVKAWRRSLDDGDFATLYQREFAHISLARRPGVPSSVSNPEVEPEIGESFGPLVWVEWGGSDDVIRVWAPVDLPDPDTYYHGYKSPLLLVAGRVVRALSDEQGEYQGQVFDVTVDDTARDLRTLLGASDTTRHLLNTRGVMRMISQADWRLKLTPRTVAIGQVRNYRLH